MKTKIPTLTDAYLQIKRPGTTRHTVITFEPAKVLIDTDVKGRLTGIEFIGVPRVVRELLETLCASTDTMRL